MQPIDTNNGASAATDSARPTERTPGRLDMREIARTVIRTELHGQRLSRSKRREIRRFAQGYGLSEREIGELLGETTVSAGFEPEAAFNQKRASIWGWGFVVLGVAGLLQAVWLLVTGTL